MNTPHWLNWVGSSRSLPQKCRSEAWPSPSFTRNSERIAALFIGILFGAFSWVVWDWRFLSVFVGLATFAFVRVALLINAKKIGTR